MMPPAAAIAPRRPRPLVAALAPLLAIALSGCAAPAPAPSAAQPAASPAIASAAAPAPAPPAAAPAAPPAPIAIRVVHNAVAGSQALLNVIQEAGLFTQHGLIVEIGNARHGRRPPRCWPARSRSWSARASTP